MLVGIWLFAMERKVGCSLVGGCVLEIDSDIDDVQEDGWDGRTLRRKIKRSLEEMKSNLKTIMGPR